MAKKELDSTTEEQILEAARKVFTKKGFAAARMEEIATEAGINRALLNYYFRSKEKIFELVFEERFKQMFGGMVQILVSDTPLFDKIRQVIDYHINTLSKNLDMPIFVLNEMNQNAEKMLERMAKAKGIPVSHIVQKVRQQAKELVSAGVIREIDGAEIFINIMSLVIFQFVGRPVIKAMLELDDEAYLQFLNRRKTNITNFVIESIQLK